MPVMIEFDGFVVEHENCSKISDDMQWYVLYKECGEVQRKDFGKDELSAKMFAKMEENAQVMYGF